MKAEDTNQERLRSSSGEVTDATEETEQLVSDPQPPRRGLQRFLIPAAFALVILGGVGWIVFNRIILPLMSSQVKPPPTRVPVANPKAAKIEDSSDYVANLNSRQSVTLQPRVSGQVSAISN
jgi:multidrug efflux pump subunit AcrA (membrane-fusion protein)